MADTTQYEIVDGDFVNSGKDKFNNAVKQLPTSLTIVNGILTLKLYKGVSLTVDLTDYFPTRTEVADQILPGSGSTTQTGLLQLAHDDNPDDLASETKPLPAAAVVRMIESYLGIGPTTPVSLLGLFYSSSDQILTAIFKKLLTGSAGNADVQALLCQFIANCGGTTPTTGNYPPTFSNPRHYLIVPDTTTLPSVYQVRVDGNTCGENGSQGSISGWCADLNHKTIAPFVRIKMDGGFMADVTCTIDRPDVLSYLKGLGLIPQDQTFCRWGWGYAKPLTTNDGTAHLWEVFGGTSDTKGTSDVGAPETTTCGAPTPLSGPTAYRKAQSTPLSVTEGGVGIQLALERKYSDGSWQAVSGLLVTWSNVDVTAGIGVDADGFFSAGANTISANTTKEVHGTVNDVVVSFNIQVLNADCTRPSGLTTYQLAWNFVPPGGNARLFTTLADANNTVGAKLDNTAPGTISTFGVNIDSVVVGKTVYNGVGTNCEVVDDKIYYVFANGLVDSVKKAIRVQNGVIVEILASTYSTCPGYGPLTTEQHDAQPIVSIIEYSDLTTPNGGLSYTVRPFASRDEAITLIATLGTSGSKAQYDANTCTTPNCNVGDTLYNDDRTEHILAHVQHLYPVEAGYWGFGYVASSGGNPATYWLLKTNACGVIVGREQITIPA